VNPARLAAIPLFAGLGDDDLSLLAGAARGVAVDAGETLAAQGRPGHAVYAIESGTAKVVADGATRARLGPGDVFGEMAMLATGHRTASVVATSPMRLIALVTDALEERSPEAAARLRELANGRRRGRS
jgi:CRP-like cAMP-binding protein